MKKFYFIPPLVTGLAYLMSHISISIAVGLLYLVPIGTFWYLHKNEADIFLEPSGVKERICMLALSNHQLVAFVAEKLEEGWLRVGNQFIKTCENDEYIYKGRILTFAIQDANMDVDEILKVKEKLNPGFLSRRAFLSSKFLQSIMIPVVGTIMLFVPLIPSIMAWMILMVGPQYLLYLVWSSGALEFSGGQSGNEITVFYISGSKKLKPATAEAVGEKWFTYKDGLGNLKVLDGTHYYFHGNRVYFSGVKTPTTFSLEHAEKAHWFRKIGLRGWKEFDRAMDIVDRGSNEFESLEEAYEKEGNNLIEKIREELKGEGEKPIAK